MVRARASRQNTSRCKHGQSRSARHRQEDTSLDLEQLTSSSSENMVTAGRALLQVDMARWCGYLARARIVPVLPCRAPFIVRVSAALITTSMDAVESAPISTNSSVAVMRGAFCWPRNTLRTLKRDQRASAVKMLAKLFETGLVVSGISYF